MQVIGNLMRLTLLWLLAWAFPAGVAVADDPPEIALGERLFLETRFAQFFAAVGQGGDPVMDVTETTTGSLPGPYAGRSMNCAACHLVDQQLDTPGGGMRTYSDFARRSPIPYREDELTHAVRNSPPLVNASLARRGGALFHFDGEFDTLHALVKATYTGRNYGWLPGEHADAVRHFAAVIRNDDGSGELAAEFGGAYRVVLEGTDPAIAPEFRLPEDYRIDVDSASDEEIFEQVTRLTAAYVADLAFSRDDTGAFNRSPYDRFLALNGLPMQPQRGETDEVYSRRLLRKLMQLDTPRYVTAADGAFAFHDQTFAFGPLELAGMKLFLTRGGSGASARGGAGNCVACHAAPDFTDFALHNTGITQLEYDAIHGAGAFAALYVPDLAVRSAAPLAWLPASEQHPGALGPFRRIPDAARPGETDLGVWNIFANPDHPGPQEKLSRLLCAEQRLAARQRKGLGTAPRRPCSTAVLLRRGIASFKTAGLRDLGHSAPYMHNGQLDSLEAVIAFYIEAAEQARDGRLRNPAPGLTGIRLAPADIAPLAAFLRALNEDYE